MSSKLYSATSPLRIKPYNNQKFNPGEFHSTTITDQELINRENNGQGLPRTDQRREQPNQYASHMPEAAAAGAANDEFSASMKQAPESLVLKALPSQIFRTQEERAQDQQKMSSLHEYQSLLYKQGYYNMSKNPVYKPKQLAPTDLPDPDAVKRL